jgi:tetratricopeptide (TPR) repeat protein
VARVSIESWEQRVITLRREQRWDEAREYVETTRQTLTGTDRAYSAVWLAHILSGESPVHYEACLTLIDNAIPQLVNNPVYHVKAALTGMLISDLAKDTTRQHAYATELRRHLMDTTRESFGYIPRIYTVLARYSERMGRMAAAEAMMKAAARFYEEHQAAMPDRGGQLAMTYVALSDFAFDQKRTRKALHYLQIAEALPSVPEALRLFIVGRQAQINGDHNTALSSFRESIRLASESRNMHTLVETVQESMGELLEHLPQDERLRSEVKGFMADARKLRFFRLTMRLHGLLHNGRGGEYKRWRSDFFGCWLQVFLW